MTEWADNAIISGEAFSSWWTDTGTLVIEADSAAIGTRVAFQADDNTADNRITIWLDDTTAKATIVTGGVQQAEITLGEVTPNEPFKVALAMGEDYITASLDGGAAVTASGITLPTVDRCRLGHDTVGNHLAGYVRLLQHRSAVLDPSKLSSPRLLAPVAMSGSYEDLSNKPIIPSVTFETLDANGDVGTGPDQVARGDHSHAEIETAVQPDDLADVATSGSYDDLTDKPTIPTNTDQLTNGAGFITSTTVTFETLNANGDVGTGSTQLAAGNHNHSGVYAPASHNHDASDITSGTLDVARIPVLPSQTVQVSSGGIANLTTAQQNNISNGTVVTTTDGRRWVYSGSGSKTSEASYIELADITPEWTSIANRPTIPTNTNQLTNGAGFITDYTVTEGDVTQHEAALTISESQISDFGSYADISDITFETLNANGDVGTGPSQVARGNHTHAELPLAVSAVQPDDLADVATSGSYDDLDGKPVLATVALTGSYFNLSNRPTLGNGAGFNIASQAEAEAGTADNRLMTPQRVKQALEAAGGVGVPAVGAIGSYVIAASTELYQTGGHLAASGKTVSGSSLVATAIANNNTSIGFGSWSVNQASLTMPDAPSLGFSGTWRLCCNVWQGTTAENRLALGLFLRIA